MRKNQPPLQCSLQFGIQSLGRHNANIQQLFQERQKEPQVLLDDLVVLIGFFLSPCCKIAKSPCCTNILV